MKDTVKERKQIAILGGGPSGLFLYKRLIETNRSDFEISIFERKPNLGVGMPYSEEGANHEHITNVSAHEVPKIVTSLEDWIKVAPNKLLAKYHISRANFNELKVLPRLLFGEYLSAQFTLLEQLAEEKGLKTNIFLNCDVVDISDLGNSGKVQVCLSDARKFEFDHVAICTGHNWPAKFEGKVEGYFDSPYPPSKIALKLDHPVALKGSSLTALDAVKTLSRTNGSFERDNDGKLYYRLNPDSKGFKIVMHSRSGLLPAVRTHLEDPQLATQPILNEGDLQQHRLQNDGFISLDYLFEKDFKEGLRTKDPEFYEQIKNLDLEAFVEKVMELRENIDPFQLLRAEYHEAEKSIKRQQSIHWKEMLGVLSVALNYPAKYFSAEDMIRLKKVLLPLIGIIIAFVPQSSVEELIALHDADIIEVISVGGDREIEIKQNGGVTYSYNGSENKRSEVYYQTFIDCVGQSHFAFEDFPFKGLFAQKAISPAKLRFKETKEALEELKKGNKAVDLTEKGEYYLKVPGIAVNDNYQIVDSYGAFNPRIYIMAVPYIGGFNPDYSGLDFCEATSKKIVDSLVEV